MALDEQDPRPGDTDNNLLRKLLLRMKSLIAAVSGGGGGIPVPLPVIVEPGDIEIGAVEIKDSATDNRVTVSSDGALLVSGTRGALTDRSGAIAIGGTSQSVMAANPNRNYLLFENVSTEDMWINFSVAATSSQPSIRVVPNGSLVMESGFISIEALNVVSATAGSQYMAKEG